MTQLTAGIGGSAVVSSASGGKITPINNLNTTPAQVIGANPSRVSIIFHNPHASINVIVAPTITTTGAALVPTTSALGGCFVIFPGGLLTISGECQTPWQAFAASSSGIPLTIMESNL